MGNTFKTAIFLALLTLLLVFIGGAIGGRGGMVFAFIFACAMNFSAYWFSDKMVLAIYRAKPLTEEQAPAVYRIVRGLTQQAQMPMPKLYLIPVQQANAFATGRNPEHAVVAVTEGILRLLPEDELKGVLAHELAHVRHRDILIATIAATMAGAIGMLGSMLRWAFMFGGSGRGSRGSQGANPAALLVTAILAPFAAMLIQMAISRSREFEADAGGARLCGTPRYLMNALQKLELAAERSPVQVDNPATAHLFIVNPLRGGGMAKLFSTHPPMAERIERLRDMVF